MSENKKQSDSTTIAIPVKTFKGLLLVEHELEIDRMETVSHGDTIEHLIQEHNGKTQGCRTKRRDDE